MDFGKAGEVVLEIEGRTTLPVNTITVRVRNEQGEETISAAEFKGTGPEKQQFGMSVPEGNSTVSFIFLPGSSFDFMSFRFERRKAGQTG